MRIFLYEFVTGGGWYVSGSSQNFPSGLLAEGAAMVRSLAADLSQVDGVSVDVLRDRRLAQLDFPRATIHEVDSAAEEQVAICAHSATADAAIVIAPELDGHLTRRARWVMQSGGRILGPAPSIIELCGDKQALAEHLTAHAVRTPAGVAVVAGENLPGDFPYPAVLKPRDGAGSLDVELIPRWNSDRLVPPNRATPGAAGGWRLESYCRGMAVSVACLCGPRQILPLAPCRQTLSEDGRFTYLGGSLPLPAPLAERAQRLALQAVRTLDGAVGYLGVDLVLGEDAGGHDDFVIEINPRLTTSYVGLRRLAKGNLAEALLVIALGRQAQVGWHAGHVAFDSSGLVHFQADHGGAVDPVGGPSTPSLAGDELAESSSL